MVEEWEAALSALVCKMVKDELEGASMVEKMESLEMSRGAVRSLERGRHASGRPVGLTPALVAIHRLGVPVEIRVDGQVITSKLEWAKRELDQFLYEPGSAGYITGRESKQMQGHRFRDRSGKNRVTREDVRGANDVD